MEIKLLVEELGSVASQLRNNIDITGVDLDSRNIKKGYCFVAIKGYTEDGHKYIEKAISNGASTIILTDDKYILDNDVNYIVVCNSRRALAIASNIFYENPSADITLIGVTGTNGKTTTAQTIEKMLTGLKKKTAVFGTIGNKVGDKIYSTNNTTPESPELNRLFSLMKEDNVNSAVIEVSSHALELDRVYGLDFDIAVFTNLTPEHLDFHGDMEKYCKAKEKLFYMTKSGNVINTDDEYGMKIYEELNGEGYDVLSVGLDKSSDISAKNIVITTKGSEFELVTPEFTTDISIKLRGRVFIYNYLCAVGVLILLGYSQEDIVLASTFIESVEGRLESVKNDKGLNVFVDYAHTPDAIDKIIDIVRELTSGKVIVVFGCGGDRDKLKRPVMGEIVSRKADMAIITSDNPRNEDSNTIISEIKAGIAVENQSKVIIEGDRRQAIELAIGNLNKEDVLVIAGKGHEDYQIIGNTKFDFDDAVIASEIINNNNMI
ncbi:MAG: UDP-N-acetylmuramoyl-L-alanyl-D-glutamate--2,6-diaminopimelate ligase [Acidaminobacteraceae bacterium]